MVQKPMDLSSKKGRLALGIAKRLHDAGYLTYFAGGCVRDHLRGQNPDDFDIATMAKPDEVERLFPKTIPVGKQFGVILVVADDIPFEVATFRGEGEYKDGRHPERVHFTNPKEDSLRRDFTINGMFYDPFEAKVIDYVEGMADLETQKIRAIGSPEKRFNEDKLRILRAIRFASNLDFPIETETWSAVCAKAPEIHQVSPERIREELVKIFTRAHAAKGFVLLSNSGLMREILPEVEAMKNVQQPEKFHPEGDVFEHTRLLLENLKSPVSEILAFGALFHDIGKPKTMELRNGRITFYEHSEVGAKMTQDIMKRLRFSNNVIEGVVSCVLNHMNFMNVQKMRSGKLKQFIAREHFMEELELHRIDCVASHGMLDNYCFLQEKLKEYAHEELKPKPLVNGHDLIEIGVDPGPGMKPILEELYELQLEGAHKTRQEALVWIKKKYSKDKKKD